MKLPSKMNWKFGMGILIVIFAFAAVPRGCDLLWGNAPLNLYGQLVDQNGGAVPGAVVSFEAMAYARVQSPDLNSPARDTTWLVRATSSKNGTFAIHDGWGRSLHLKSIAAPRYSQGCFAVFYYGRRQGVAVYHPDEAHPVRLLCWNDAFKRIISNTVRSHVGSDLYGLAYRSGGVSEYGTGDENLHFRVVRTVGNPQKPYDWSLEVRSPFPATKEVLAAEGPLKFEAPASGYEHELIFKMNARDPNWSNQLTKQFYTCSHDGAVYAGVEMKVQLAADGGDPIVTIDYTANFGSSRDLVPGPILPARK